MLPPPPNGPLLDIRQTFGALLIGAFASVGLLGVLTLQCWLYYSQFPNDPRFVKLLVAAIWVLEFVRSCFMVNAVYFYTVLQWGNPAGLVYAHWSLEAILILTFLVELIVHLYFTYRVWIISGRKRVVPGIILFFTISTFITGVCEYGSSIKEAKFSKITGGITGDWALAALACVIVTDWLITASLVYYLRQCLSETGFSRSNTIVGRLIFYAINIGVLTSAGDLVVLALCASQIRGLYYLALFEIVANLYANSVLASLNARTALRDTTHEPYVSSIHIDGALMTRNSKQEQSVIPQESTIWSSSNVKREDIELNIPSQSARRT